MKALICSPHSGICEGAILLIPTWLPRAIMSGVSRDGSLFACSAHELRAPGVVTSPSQANGRAISQGAERRKPRVPTTIAFGHGDSMMCKIIILCNVIQEISTATTETDVYVSLREEWRGRSVKGGFKVARPRSGACKQDLASHYHRPKRTHLQRQWVRARQGRQGVAAQTTLLATHPGGDAIRPVRKNVWGQV